MTTHAEFVTPAQFMTAGGPAPVNGNSPWASRYSHELRRVVAEHAAAAPRQLQTQLGPSGMGVLCHRQVVGTMAGLPAINQVSDPWPSIVGTAVHAWLAEAFTADNVRHDLRRWIAEQRVTPHPDHPGTADLYDAVEQAVVDHKVLGETSLAKLRSPDGPPRRYVVQLLLYGLGYRRLGLPVKRVVLAAYPRTGSRLDGIYVWDHPWTSADNQLLDEVFDQTRQRRVMADLVTAGRLDINQVPRTPGEDCFFCPLYSPRAREGDPGCPGTTTTT